MAAGFFAWVGFATDLTLPSNALGSAALVAVGAEFGFTVVVVLDVSFFLATGDADGVVGRGFLAAAAEGGRLISGVKKAKQFHIYRKNINTVYKYTYSCFILINWKALI